MSAVAQNSTISTSIESIDLTAISDLQWPTDPMLVASFRKTLAHGGDVPLLLVNRVDGQYEIIDGFHRYDAAKSEGITTILCQVVSYDERTARYSRIQACTGKPAKVTYERAKIELRRAFASEIRGRLGIGTIIYEPILTEDLQLSKRNRKTPLPDDPIQALTALTDHILLLREEHYATHRDTNYPADMDGDVIHTVVLSWLTEMEHRFGFNEGKMMELIGEEAWKVAFPVQTPGQYSVNGAMSRALMGIPDSAMRELIAKRSQSVSSYSNGTLIHTFRELIGWECRFGFPPHTSERKLRALPTRSQLLQMLATRNMTQVVSQLRQKHGDIIRAEEQQKIIARRQEEERRVPKLRSNEEDQHRQSESIPASPFSLQPPKRDGFKTVIHGPTSVEQVGNPVFARASPKFIKVPDSVVATPVVPEASIAEDLRHKLAIACQSLRYYADNNHDAGKCAQEALKQIGEVAAI